MPKYNSPKELYGEAVMEEMITGNVNLEKLDADMMTMMLMVTIMGCTKNPISTLSHIWVFVRLYGIVFVIIVIIIIIMIIKSEGVNTQL